jgi:threonine dehydratase
VSSVLVRDDDIVRTRRMLWDDMRLAVEHAAATALAGLPSPTGRPAAASPVPAAPDGYGYVPAADETVAVVLSGANTDPGDLVRTDRAR